MIQNKIKSPAKINLYLHLTDQDHFNYHTIDTLVCFLPDLYDEITIKETNNNSHIIETIGPWQHFVNGQNIVENVLQKINHLLQQKTFHITIKKNIPVGAGLGGGSSNAAYLLNHLIDRCQLSLSQTEKLKICSEIGADVSMFNYKNALYAMGIGNIIFPTISFPDKLFVLLVYPKHSLSTKNIYNNYSSQFSKHITHDYKLDIKTLLKLLKQTKNDLYLSSLDFLPELSNIIKTINSLDGCLFARMSGSGSSCFGIFHDQNMLQLARSKLGKKMPDFFITQSRIQ